VKEQAEKLAANGYVTLAVDLYQGKVTADPSEARKLKRCLRQKRAIRDLKAAFDYLADRPDVTQSKSVRSGGPWAAAWRCNSRFMSRGLPHVS
jgi:carboxymethylenebutenolidase